LAEATQSMKSMTTEKKKKEDVPLEEDLDERCVGVTVQPAPGLCCYAPAGRCGPLEPPPGAGERAWAASQSGAAQQALGASHSWRQRALAHAQTCARCVLMRPAHPPLRSEHVNIVFIGHVDAGKSTIGGQILFLTVRASERAPLAPRAAQPSRPPRGAGERGRALDPEVRARGEGEEPRELVHGTALRSSRLRGVAAAGTPAPGAWAQRLRANVAPGVVTPHASRCAARESPQRQRSPPRSAAAAASVASFARRARRPRGACAVGRAARGVAPRRL
jgi:hypothetical protein